MGKRKGVIFAATAMLLAFAATMMLIGCTSTKPDPVPVPEQGSILLFMADNEECQKLVSDAAEGVFPKSCRVSFNGMEITPDVVVDDPMKVAELYEAFSKIKVEGATDLFATDSSWSIVFTLQDNATVGFGFDAGAWHCRDGNSYEISGSGEFWDLVHELEGR